MTALIQTLIDKTDTFELVRDKVARILAEESAQQQQLAIAEGKDPTLWKLRVFTERSNPWEFLRTDSGALPADLSPVVSVWFDNSNIDPAASQTIDSQNMQTAINIDVYGIGTLEVSGGGHTPGDEAAALEVQRAARLVRNIIMSDSYTRLDLRGIVGQRLISAIQAFQPEFANQNARHLAGLRLTLQVKCLELAPQTPAVILEEINTLVKNENGEVLIDATFQSTP